MKFTTKLVLRKDKPEEKYDYPVLTQHSYDSKDKRANSKFELNAAAMVGFDFEPNTPNVNKINWGVEEESGLLLLANTKGLIEDKLSQITASNTFANQTFMDRLVKDFSINPLEIHEFRLNLQPDENGFIVATLDILEEVKKEFITNPEEPMSDTPLEDLCDSYQRIIPGETANEIF
jgi:hypothetical protein